MHIEEAGLTPRRERYGAPAEELHVDRGPSLVRVQLAGAASLALSPA